MIWWEPRDSTPKRGASNLEICHFESKLPNLYFFFFPNPFSLLPSLWTLFLVPSDSASWSSWRDNFAKISWALWEFWASYALMQSMFLQHLLRRSEPSTLRAYDDVCSAWACYQNTEKRTTPLTTCNIPHKHVIFVNCCSKKGCKWTMCE